MASKKVPTIPKPNHSNTNLKNIQILNEFWIWMFGIWAPIVSGQGKSSCKLNCIGKFCLCSPSSSLICYFSLILILRSCPSLVLSIIDTGIAFRWVWYSDGFWIQSEYSRGSKTEYIRKWNVSKFGFRTFRFQTFHRSTTFMYAIVPKRITLHWIFGQGSLKSIKKWRSGD